VAEGTATELARLANSATGRCLAAPYRHSRSHRRTVGRETPSIEVGGANLHNLDHVDARIPLGRLTVITGVSGSGKSSLARDVLFGNLKQLLARPNHSRSNNHARNNSRSNGSSATRRSSNASRPPWAASPSPVGKPSAACSKSIRRRSARTPRSCPPRTSGSGTRSAGSMRNHRRPDSGFHRQPLLVQHGRRPLRGVRGSGHAAHRDDFLPDVQVLCDVCGGRTLQS